MERRDRHTNYPTSKYFRIIYTIDFPERAPKGYLMKEEYISNKTISEKEFEKRLNDSICEKLENLKNP